MSDKASSTKWPTGENLAATQDDYTNIPGATPFFKLDSKDFDLENYTPSTGLPSNPQDYLRNVMLEARNCPNVVVAKSRPTKIKQNNLNLPEEEDIPGGKFAPTKEWSQEQVSNFSLARSEFSRHLALLKSIKRQTKKRPKLPIYPLPAWDDKFNWRLLSLGNNITKNNSDSPSSPVVNDVNMDTADEKCLHTNKAESGEDACGDAQASCSMEEDRIVDLSNLKDGYPPLLRMLLRMDTKHVESNLEFHVQWLQTYGFSHQQGRWIYALLVCLEKPLFPTVVSTLRDLARQCARLRTTYTSETEQLNGLNLIICIVGKYFDQSDLLDAT